MGAYERTESRDIIATNANGAALSQRGWILLQPDAKRHLWLVCPMMDHLTYARNLIFNELCVTHRASVALALLSECTELPVSFIMFKDMPR